MRKIFPLFLGLGFLMSALVLADASIVVPDGDPLVALLQLLQNWGTAVPLAKATAVIMILVQAVKKLFPGFVGLRFVVVIGGIAYAVVNSLATGLSLANSITLVLLSSGGAVALYELFFKPVGAAVAAMKGPQ